MRIVMVGSGYVGLVSGACFADFGHEIVCVDKDEGKIERLRAGESPIFEPGLDVLLKANIRAGRLTFTTDLKAAADGADAFFIAVGTPTRRGDGHADLTYVPCGRRGDRRVAREGAGGGDEVDRAGRHGRRGGEDHRRQAPGSGDPRGLQTRSSCARARRSRTSSAPTAS